MISKYPGTTVARTEAQNCALSAIPKGSLKSKEITPLGGGDFTFLGTDGLDTSHIDLHLVRKSEVQQLHFSHSSNFQGKTCHL